MARVKKFKRNYLNSDLYGIRDMLPERKKEIWRPALFWKIQDNIDYPYLTIINGDYAQCIPYEGNEKLIDTSNNPTIYDRT